MAETTGKIDFRVGSETFQTWYKVVGELGSGKRALVTLHGGPGVPHNYLIPHIDLVKSLGIPVIFYDQLGAGESTQLRDKPKEFWTVDLFMNELDNLLAHFGIADNFDLLGHSWGGMLGSHYASHRHPTGLKHLIIADSPASMPLWEEAVEILLNALPEEERLLLRKHEQEGTTDSPEFQTGMMKFYAKHVCRLDPWPEELSASFASMEANPTVYKTMNGPSEFTVVGSLKTWSVVDVLHTIKSSTLLINGAFDEAQDVCVAPFFARIPKVKWVQLANSSHMPFHEERERYMQVVGDFLSSVI